MRLTSIGVIVAAGIAAILALAVAAGISTAINHTATSITHSIPRR